MNLLRRSPLPSLLGDRGRLPPHRCLIIDKHSAAADADADNVRLEVGGMVIVLHEGRGQN